MPEKQVPTKESRWLTMGQACHILSVTPATLRHWADAGRVRIFRTVGGHRRFSRDDVTGLVERTSAPHAVVGGPDGEDMALRKLHRRLRQEPDRWHGAFDEEGRLRMRLLGRQLLGIATAYMAQKKRRPRLQQEARFIGQEYGTELARRGLSLKEVVEAFLFFRRSLTDATLQAAGNHHAPDEVGDAWRDVYGLADIVLLAVAEAYERVPRPSQQAAQQ